MASSTTKLRLTSTRTEADGSTTLVGVTEDGRTMEVRGVDWNSADFGYTIQPVGPLVFEFKYENYAPAAPEPSS